MALPLPSAGNRGGQAPRTAKQNWLQDEDIKGTVAAKIVDAKAGDTARVAVTLKLKLPQGIRFDSMGTTNPNFKILFDAFGADEQAWKGKTVNIAMEHDTFSDRDWRRYAVGK